MQRQLGGGLVYATLREFSVHSVLDVRYKIKPDTVLLDNQADVSVVLTDLLEDIQECDPVRINGIGGVQIVVNETGYLRDLDIRVYTNSKVMCSVVSFAEVEDRYKVLYLPREGFVVHLDDRDICFKRCGKLFVAEWYEVMTRTMVCATTQENEATYTKKEVSKAKTAYELIKTSGYPSVSEFVGLLEHGNVVGIPSVTWDDVRRAYKIYGQPVAYVRGKMTKKKVDCVQYSEELKSCEREQVLYADVMTIDTK